MPQHVRLSIAFLVLIAEVLFAKSYAVDPPANGPTCNGMTKQHLSSFAINNTLMITVVDQLVMQTFGKSWVENVKSAGISYWMVAALDPWTSRLLGHWGVKQCFNAPLDKMRSLMRGSGKLQIGKLTLKIGMVQLFGAIHTSILICCFRMMTGLWRKWMKHNKGQGHDRLGSETRISYMWGSKEWHETTWNKVYVISAVYELGFNVIHSDTDVTWFKVHGDRYILICCIRVKDSVLST